MSMESTALTPPDPWDHPLACCKVHPTREYRCFRHKGHNGNCATWVWGGWVEFEGQQKPEREHA